MSATEITVSKIFHGVRFTVSAFFPAEDLSQVFEPEPIDSKSFDDPDYQSLMAAETMKLLQQAVHAAQLGQCSYQMDSLNKMRKEAGLPPQPTKEKE